MRVNISDSIRIFDGKTGEWLAKVLSINRENTVLRVVEKIRNMILSHDIWIIFAPIKHQRMNIVIQKATELGITKAIPCFTEYTSLNNININNLQINAIEAAEQSERLDIPKIEEPVKLKFLLESWPEDRHLIYCNERLNSKKTLLNSLSNIKNDNKKIAILVGPEGGFSESENELIRNNRNVLSVSLGNRLLRSDTAITVALFCIQELIK